MSLIYKYRVLDPPRKQARQGRLLAHLSQGLLLLLLLLLVPRVPSPGLSHPMLADHLCLLQDGHSSIPGSQDTILPSTIDSPHPGSQPPVCLGLMVLRAGILLFPVMPLVVRLLSSLRHQCPWVSPSHLSTHLLLDLILSLSPTHLPLFPQQSQ